MGRLFWRFFWFFWLAQVATSLAVGGAVWLLLPIPDAAVPVLMQPPPHPPSLFPLVMPMLIGGVVSLVFAAVMAAYVARPIRRLDQAFQSIAEGKLDERIGEALGRSCNELTALGSGFDRMAARLQSLVESQRRLLHDVSHEMRAPLARLQAAADLMERSPQQHDELTARVHADIERINRLVNELLTLARLETGNTGGQPERILLRELLDVIAGDARFDAIQKQCEVLVNCPPTLELIVHHELLHRAIDNVIRNAIRYAPERSHIALRGSVDGRQVQITVDDQGKGVADEELVTIFDPFVRGAKTAGEGHGLGLAITRRALEAHGGTVVAANLAEGGFRICMRLPLTK